MVGTRATRKRAALVGVVMTATLVAAACSAAPPPYPLRSTDCAVASSSCALPFPSDRWLVADSHSATGFHIEVPQGQFPSRLTDQLGPGASLADAFRGSDGFSALTPIIFQFPDTIDQSSLPTDGGTVVVVKDAQTGERQAIRAEVSGYGTDQNGGHGVLLIWPRTVFPYGHRITAYVTDALKTTFGRSVRVANNLYGGPGGASQPEIDRILGQVSHVSANQAVEHVIGATSFVVATKSNTTDPVDQMAAIVRQRQHPVRNLVTSPSLLGGVAMVTGQVQATDFRNRDGVIVKGMPLEGRDRWLDFVMTLPAAPPPGLAKVPVVVYGHGLSVFKETMFVAGPTNAERGLATIAIDVPNHGSRNPEDGYLVEVATPNGLGKLTSLPAQGAVDELSLVLAIKSSLTSVDVLPYNLFGSAGDGHADLDPTRILYEGTSMGGFLGSTLLAIAPEIRGGFLQVPGSGIIDTLFHSLFWVILQNAVPSGAGVGDAHALVAGAQSMIDRGDSAHFVDRIRAQGTSLFLSYGTHDGVVANETTERLAALTGVPFVGPQYVDMWSPSPLSKRSTMTADGSGVQQIDNSDLADNPLSALLTHLSFAKEESMNQLRSWLDLQVSRMR